MPRALLTSAKCMKTSNSPDRSRSPVSDACVLARTALVDRRKFISPARTARFAAAAKFVRRQTYIGKTYRQARCPHYAMVTGMSPAVADMLVVIGAFAREQVSSR